MFQHKKGPDGLAMPPTHPGLILFLHQRPNRFPRQHVELLPFGQCRRPGPHSAAEPRQTVERALQPCFSSITCTLKPNEIRRVLDHAAPLQNFPV